MDTEKYKSYTLKIIKADMEKLTVSLPFFARAVYALKPIVDKYPLTGTDGAYYFLNSLNTVEEFMKGVDTSAKYLHSVLHSVYLHPFFANRYNEELVWDIATDISIFDICNSIGITQNAEAEEIIQNFKDESVYLSAQSLYRYMRKKIADGLMDESNLKHLSDLFKVDDHDFWRPSKNDNNQNGSQNDKDDKDNNDEDNSETESKENEEDNDKNNSQNNSEDNRSESDSQDDLNNGETAQDMPSLSELIEKWTDIADHVEVGLQIEIKAKKSQGLEAGHLLETLNNIKRDELSYEKFLRKFAVLEEKLSIDMDSFDYNYYTYGLELYGDTPLIEPLEYKEEYSIRDFVVAIDTSGSCDIQLVKKFLEKTYRILTETAIFSRKINVHIIQCDAVIQDDVEIHSEEEIKKYIENLQIKGRGGTDFRPVFNKIEEIRAKGGLTNIRGLIYFTDGYGIFPSLPPKYKTAFAFAEVDKNVKVPPWAMKVYIEEEGLS